MVPISTTALNLREYMSWTKKILVCGLAAGCTLVVLMAAPLPQYIVKRLVLAMPELFLPEMEKAGDLSLLSSAIELKLQIEFQRLLAINSSAPADIESVSKQIARVHDLMITQRQINGVKIYWGASTAQSLVRGFGFCDQINGALALVLAPSFSQSDLYALRKGDNSPHSLVRLRSSDLGEFYVDAWSDTPVFQLGQATTPEIPLFGMVKAGLQVSLPEIDESYLEQGFVLSRYDFWSRAKKALRRVAQKILLFPAKNDSSPEIQDGAIREAVITPSGDTQYGNSTVAEEAGSSTERESPDAGLVATYLIARLDHIYGERDKAVLGYDAVAQSGCTSDFCLLAREFSKNLHAAESS